MGDGEWGWSCPGIGMDGVRGGCWVVRPSAWSENLKPYTLSCTPCSQAKWKMLGQCEDRHLCSRIWFGVDRWIRRHTARGPQTHPHAELQIHLTVVLETTCDGPQGKRWLTQNEAVNAEILYTPGLDREVYAQEETNKQTTKKKTIHGYSFSKR